MKEMIMIIPTLLSILSKIAQHPWQGLLIVSCNIFDYLPHITPSFFVPASKMPRALRQEPLEKRYCPICSSQFHLKAFTSHYKKCKCEKRATDRLGEYKHDKTEQLYAQFAGSLCCVLL
jgi:hypothetical protein